MMKWRRRMLRRKTDPKTGKRTVCEPLQSKCTRTFHKSHCVCVGIYRENGRGHLRSQHFVRACAVEIHMDISQEAFCADLTGKMPDAHPAASILGEPAQSTCIWACHKRHFVRKFTRRLRGKLVLLFLARPAGQSVLSSAGRPARRVYEPRPAGRPDSVCVLAGRPARSLPGCFCIGFVFGWPAGRPAGCLVGWLGGWLSLLDVFVFG